MEKNTIYNIKQQQLQEAASAATIQIKIINQQQIKQHHAITRQHVYSLHAFAGSKEN